MQSYDKLRQSIIDDYVEELKEEFYVEIRAAMKLFHKRNNIQRFINDFAQEILSSQDPKKYKERFLDDFDKNVLSRTSMGNMNYYKYERMINQLVGHLGEKESNYWFKRRNEELAKEHNTTDLRGLQIPYYTRKYHEMEQAFYDGEDEYFGQSVIKPTLEQRFDDICKKLEENIFIQESVGAIIKQNAACINKKYPDIHYEVKQRKLIHALYDINKYNSVDSGACKENKISNSPAS